MYFSNASTRTLSSSTILLNLCNASCGYFNWAELYIDCYWWSISEGRICGGNAVAAVRLHICLPRPNGLFRRSVLLTFDLLIKHSRHDLSNVCSALWHLYCRICMCVNGIVTLRSSQGVCLRMVTLHIRCGCKYSWELTVCSRWRCLKIACVTSFKFI